jgi:hypothetical protein
MIRYLRFQVKTRVVISVLLGFSVLLTCFAIVAEAGDQDGLGGYSMTLKRKYFDGSGSGSGGPGQSVYVSPKPGDNATAPALQKTVVRVQVDWLNNLQHYFPLFVSWSK